LGHTKENGKCKICKETQWARDIRVSSVGRETVRGAWGSKQRLIVAHQPCGRNVSLKNQNQFASKCFAALAEHDDGGNCEEEEEAQIMHKGCNKNALDVNAVKHKPRGHVVGTCGSPLSLGVIYMLRELLEKNAV
jgi:hypothetical protein